MGNTHLLVCKNPKALEYLFTEDTCCCLIASASKQGKPVAQGDALWARNELLDGGFKWGKDFFIKIVNE